MVNVVFAVALGFSAAGADGQTLAKRFTSCDLKVQHALKGALGNSVKDPRQALILMRSDILEADLDDARKAGRLTQGDAERLHERVGTVKAGADRYTRQQGFLSAAEVASYDRALDAVAERVYRS